VGAAAVCVAGLALRDIDRHFAWEAWHLWQFSAVGAAAVCVAGVALRNLDRHFVWQAWHLANLGDIDLHFAWRAWNYGTGLALVARLVPVWRRGRRRCLRGRRGTW